MSRDQIIVIFFRLLNFGIIIGILAYLWKRFGRAYVVSAYEKEQAYLAGLIQSHKLLYKEKQVLRDRIYDDDVERAVLTERLLLWRDVIQKKQDALEAEKEERIRIIQQQLQLQVNRVREHQLYRHIKEEAVAEVRDRLIKEYASERKQQAVIATIIKRLDSV